MPEASWHWMNFLADSIIWVIIFVGMAQNAVSMILLLTAGTVMHKRLKAENPEVLWKQRAPSAPSISLIAPAYNEANTILESVKSQLSLHYPDYEVIVVNDGSRDETLALLKQHFNLLPIQRAHELVAKHKPIREIYKSAIHENLIVVDKENGGKADALNAGLNVARNSLFCAVDSDSMLEADALLYAVAPFLEEPDKVIAVGGTIRAANGCRVHGGKVVKVGLPHQLLPLIQTVEYIRAFLVARIGMSELGILTLISGAFGIFRRRAALAVGGYATDTVGEDYELVLRMHRYHLERGIPYAIKSVGEPVCWTEVPDDLKTMANQRRRWQRGGLETFFKHRHMCLNPKYGRLGMVGMPFAFITDVLGPITELIGYLLVPIFWFSGILNPQVALAFLALTFIFGVFISAGSLVLEEAALRRMPKALDLLKLVGVMLLENFGFRQLNNIWRLQGWWQYLRKQHTWGEMKRTGFKKH
jgi:cellulose synthase/poly-beta-1,6-N-acetylglucosamine synthase-like glycosyltransferase